MYCYIHAYLDSIPYRDKISTATLTLTLTLALGDPTFPESSNTMTPLPILPDNSKIATGEPEVFISQPVK